MPPVLTSPVAAENTHRPVPQDPPLCLRCRDVGMDCDFEARETSLSDLLHSYRNHALHSHNMEVFPSEVLYRIKNSIRK